MARRAAIIIEAVDRASPVFSRTRSGLQALGGVAAAVGVYQFGRLFKAGLEAAVAASAQQERAETKLAVALANTGQSIRGTLPGLKAYASELQRATGIGDELILENQAILVSIGKLRGEGLERATKAALDLSASGVDLKTAFELVGKAAAGETGRLKRYGIVIGDSIPQAEKFEAALGKLESTFGGQAAARLRTYEGQLTAVSGKFGDLAEIIGGPLREVGTAFLSEFLGPLIDDLQESATETDGFRLEVLDLADVLTAVLEPVELLTRNVSAFASALRVGLGVAKSAGPVMGNVAGALVLATAEFDASTAATDRLRATLARLREEGGAGDAIGTDAQEALARVNAATEAWIDTFTRVRPELEAISIGILDQKDLVGFTEEEVLRLKASWEITEQATKDATAAALDLGLAMEKDVEPPVLRLGATIDRVIRDRAVAGALALGDTLVDAAFGAKVAWGDFFRQLLADLAKAIVQALILRAVAGVLTGGTGFFFARGGAVPGGAPVRAAAGFAVPGPPNRGDVVPALLRPGELVLNRDQQREIRGGAGSGPLTVRVELGPNLRRFADALTVEVERGGARLVATETVRPVRARRT